MKAQPWIIGLVLLSAPTSVILSRLWVRADEAVLSAPTSRIASRDMGRDRGTVEPSALRRVSGD